MIRTAAGFLLACVTVGPATFMLADTEPPFIRIAGEIVPNALHAEDIFEVHWTLHVNKHRRCRPYGPRAVEQSIIDSSGAVKDYEPVPSIADPSNVVSSINRVKKLPMGLTSGPARYRAVAKFTCNWLQQLTGKVIVIDEPEIPFTILPQR